ncbi:MAG: hypothetical protein IJC43_02895 [Clostridia bacterium]|nr:hypothetical protein [Clostridia bacterium]
MNRFKLDSGKKEPSLETSLSLIAWGSVVLYFDFRINFGFPINLLPDWVAYMMYYVALDGLGKAVPTALLLRPLSVLLGVWKAVSPLVEGSLSGVYTTAALIANVIGLYYHFQLLSDLAALAEQRNFPQQSGLLRLRNFRTVLFTLLSLPMVGRWLEQQGEWAAMVVLAAVAVLVLWTWHLLFSLKKSLTAALSPPIPDPLDPAP